MLSPNSTCRHLSLLLLPLLLLAASAASAGVDCDSTSSNSSSSSSDWVRLGDSCYRWTEAPNYWYPAEQRCKGSSGGHLVSIGSELENTLVGRLTYCQSAWIGRYGVNADRLGDPGNYRWTDLSSPNSFQRHNFSRLATPHQPLVTAENLQWHNNYYHDRSGYVCEAPATKPENNGTASFGCPSREWRRHDNHCYLQPNFPATYIEAGYFCDGRQAQLVSVHTEPELRLLSLLDLGLASCTVELWLGLVKLNPCRVDFSTGQQICYRWTDRSGDYASFPAWAAGHPNGDLVTNCVVLKDRSMRSEPCHLRRSFVCKRPAAGILPPTLPPPATTRPPTQPPQPETAPPPTQTPQINTPRPPTPDPIAKIVAAYDFRRGLQNLAISGRFRVLDVGHAAGIGSPDGAVFNGSRGLLVDTEASELTRPLKRGGQWTVFYRATRATDYDEILVDVGGSSGEPSLTLIENPDTTDLSLYGSGGYFRDESNQARGATDKQRPWLRAAVVVSGSRATFYRNGVDVSNHRPATSVQPYPDNFEHLMLGNAYRSALPGYRGAIVCFGVAHAALTPEEIEAAFMRYC